MKIAFNRWLAIGGVGALLFAVGGLTPARADRGYDRALRQVHHDNDVIDRDQRHLDDLNRKADDQRYRRDWRGLHRTEEQIDHAKLDLRRDRENLRIDQEALNHYRRW